MIDVTFFLNISITYTLQSEVSWLPCVPRGGPEHGATKKLLIAEYVTYCMAY